MNDDRLHRPLVRARRIALGLVMPCLLAVPAAAQTPSDAAPGDDYMAGVYGRVRYEENGASILRAEPEAAGEAGIVASVNLAVFPGDEVTTGADQRVEVQLAQGSLVRIDRATRLTFLSLPDPYAEHPDHSVLQLVEGAVRIAATLAGAEEFRIDTPAASIYLLGDADLRVDVDSSGRTRVESRRGVAEVVGNGGSVLLRGGMRSQVLPGAVPDTPVAFNTLEADGFDRWVALREDDYREQLAAAADAAPEAYAALPDEVRPYQAELSANGSWVETADLGWVWVPNGVASDWRPYSDGYWDYGPSGYFWVSSEPWGWAPYHYGRWCWNSGFGWGWVPGRVFAGAWVSWSWGSAYIGWSPLDCWGYPVYAPYSWVYCGYGDFYYTHYHGHHGHHGYYDGRYRTAHEVGDSVRNNAIVTRPPKARPGDLADSPETRERVVREMRDMHDERLDRAARSATAERSGQRFDLAERQVISRGERATAAERASRVSPGRGSSVVRPPLATSGRSTQEIAPRGASRPAATPRAAPAPELRSYPRTLSTPRSERARISPATPQASGRSSTTSRTPRAATPAPRGASRPSGVAPRPGGTTQVPRVETRQSSSGSRLREMYRDLARPRQTRRPPAPSTSGRSSAAPRSSRAPSGSGRSAARPTPRSSGGSSARPAPSRSAPSRSTGSSSRGGSSRGSSSRGSSSRGGGSRGSARRSGGGS